MLFIFIWNKSTPCVISGYKKWLLAALCLVNMQCFQRKGIKTFVETSIGLMLFPLHLGYFISHWITNQILLTKLWRRPLTHNYVVWIMAVCMKYKCLDSIDFFSFMCLKETEKINGICLGIVRKGSQCTYELAHNVMSPSHNFTFPLAFLYQILWYLI